LSFLFAILFLNISLMKLTKSNVLLHLYNMSTGNDFNP